MQKEFAELIGAFIGDGWISRGNSGLSLFISGNPKDEKAYYNNKIVPLFSKTFNFQAKAREFPYWGTYGILIANQAVINRFIQEGMPVGKKALNIGIPDGIKKNKKLYNHFLRGYFDTDGCIHFQKSYGSVASKWQKQYRHRPVIEFSTVSATLCNDVQEMASQLNFNFRNKRPHKGKKDKNPAYRLRLEGKENVKRWFLEIKPNNKKHVDRFKIWKNKGYFPKD